MPGNGADASAQLLRSTTSAVSIPPHSDHMSNPYGEDALEWVATPVGAVATELGDLLRIECYPCPRSIHFSTEDG